MTLLKKDHRSRASVRRSGWLLSVVLCIVGLSAVGLSGNSAFIGGAAVNPGEPVPGADADPGQTGGDGKTADGPLRTALSFSTSRSLRLNDGRGTAEIDPQEVLVSVSIHGDLSRIKPVGGGFKLSF